MELEEGDASDPGEMFRPSFKEVPVFRTPVRKGWAEKISKGKKGAGNEQESSAKSEAESSGRVRVD